MMPTVFVSLRDRILSTRVALELFPRCVKCGGDLRDERLRNVVAVIGRERRHMHGCCPRAQEAA